MDKLYAHDFNMVESNPNGQFVRISELNQMIGCGALSVDRKKWKITNPIQE